MKKFAAIIAVLSLVLCLSACGKGYYEDGYADGYADGYSDAESDMQYLIEDKCLEWYDMGYDDGWVDNIDEIGRFFEEEAVDFVRDHCEWHPEEAVGIIEAYQNNESFYEDGSHPSRQDYLDAIDSLIYFYEYFYGSYYE